MASTICDRIRSNVEEQLFSVRHGTMIGVGVSLGVACFPDDGETSEELLTAAARRMQQDKHGRKTVLTVAEAGISSIDMMT
jgi:diguanylate cyclase (GGDEF)-like protein